LNHEELAAMADAGNYHGLWEAALPLARFTIRKLIDTGELRSDSEREELQQEAYLACGEAVRSWRAGKGAFSTWIVSSTRSALLKWRTRESGAMLGNGGLPASIVYHPGEPATQENGGAEFFNPDTETLLAYADPPEGLDDPYVEVYRDQRRGRAILLLRKLRSPEHQEMLCRLYGIGCEPQTMEEYAARTGLPLRTIAWRTSRLLKYLAKTSAIG
jgi:RNA polymerase sigma factor (sigma-70 family)